MAGVFFVQKTLNFYKNLYVFLQLENLGVFFAIIKLSLTRPFSKVSYKKYKGILHNDN